jgi:hypothetical protein
MNPTESENIPHVDTSTKLGRGLGILSAIERRLIPFDQVAQGLGPVLDLMSGRLEFRRLSREKLGIPRNPALLVPAGMALIAAKTSKKFKERLSIVDFDVPHLSSLLVKISIGKSVERVIMRFTGQLSTNMIAWQVEAGQIIGDSYKVVRAAAHSDPDLGDALEDTEKWATEPAQEAAESARDNKRLRAKVAEEVRPQVERELRKKVKSEVAEELSSLSDSLRSAQPGTTPATPTPPSGTDPRGSRR